MQGVIEKGRDQCLRIFIHLIILIFFLILVNYKNLIQKKYQISIFKHIIHYPNTHSNHPKFAITPLLQHLPETNSLVCPMVKETTIYQRFSIQNSIRTPFYPHAEIIQPVLSQPPNVSSASRREPPLQVCVVFIPPRISSSRIYKARDFGDYALPTSSPFPLLLYPSARSVTGVADRTLLRCRGVLRIDVVHRVHSEFPSARYTNEFPAPRARNTITG